ncbi:MAG: hypothetical protein M3Q29_22765 [Chloroflexota bacterium]|nr:hypothetical protein [Chloroflexota bacterium]
MAMSGGGDLTTKGSVDAIAGDGMCGGVLRDSFGRLIDFLDQLEGSKIHYDLKHVRDSIMIRAYLPEGLWEIEFLRDGTLEVELFRREGSVEAVPEGWLDRFIESNRD